MCGLPLVACQGQLNVSLASTILIASAVNYGLLLSRAWQIFATPPPFSTHFKAHPLVMSLISTEVKIAQTLYEFKSQCKGSLKSFFSVLMNLQLAMF